MYIYFKDNPKWKIQHHVDILTMYRTYVLFHKNHIQQIKTNKMLVHINIQKTIYIFMNQTIMLKWKLLLKKQRYNYPICI